MARIRTIKPEFWTDIKVVRLRFQTRLFFIGIWNFADDEGYVAYEPDELAMQIFPADDVDAAAMLDELIAAELLEVMESESSGKLFLRIPNFLKHQRISHPQPSVNAPEYSRKRRGLPAESRRLLAIKYGAKPGERVECSCYYCGQAGYILWPLTSKGKPSFWPIFSLEVDHFVARSKGGDDTCENLVFACRLCNRGKRDRDSVARFLGHSGNAPGTSEEHSGNVPGTSAEHSSLKGIEGKGIEGKKTHTHSTPRARAPKKPAVAGRACSLQEVEEFFLERKTSVSAKEFFAYYEANGWRQSNGNPIRNWRACLTTWEARAARQRENSSSHHHGNGQPTRMRTIEEIARDTGKLLVLPQRKPKEQPHDDDRAREHDADCESV